MPHITDYTTRAIARESYINWIRQAENKLRNRPTPAFGVTSPTTTTGIPTKKQLRDSI